MHAGSPRTKLLYLYRDPIPTIASFCKMMQAIPKVVLKHFLPMLVQIALDSSHYQGEQLQLLQNRLAEAIKQWDMVEFNTLSLLANIAAYKHAKDKGVPMHVVKYEILLQDPKGQLVKILNFCHVPFTNHDLETCLQAMQSDSQAGSIIGRKQQDKDSSKKDFGSLHTAKINETLSLFGFPTTDRFDCIFS